MASRHLNNVRLASHGLDNQSNVQLVGNGKHTPSVPEESPIKQRGRGVQKQFWHAPPSDADRMVAPPRRRRERRTSAEGHCTHCEHPTYLYICVEKDAVQSGPGRKLLHSLNPNSVISHEISVAAWLQIRFSGSAE